MHCIILKQRGVTQKIFSLPAWTVILDITGVTLSRLGISQESVHGFLDPESTPGSTQHPSCTPGAVLRFEWCLFSSSILNAMAGVSGWVNQACGWLGKGRATSGLTLDSFCACQRSLSLHLFPTPDSPKGPSLQSFWLYTHLS